MGNLITSRRARLDDVDDIRRIYAAAFPESESERVARLAIELLEDDSLPVTFSWMAEKDDHLIAHIAFSPVGIKGNDQYRGYILAPLAVQPDYQRQGVGSLLINEGLRALNKAGVQFVFVYGDPDYYGRFGFRVEIAEVFRAPYELQYPFGWQAKFFGEVRLSQGVVDISCVTALCDPQLW